MNNNKKELFAWNNLEEDTDTSSSSSSSSSSDDDRQLVSLRAFRYSDIDDFMMWARAPELRRFSGGDSPETRQQAIELLRFRMYGHPWHWSICLGGRSIGEISVTTNPHPCNACRAEVGFALGPAYWGCGFATMALKMVVEKVLNDDYNTIARLEAIVDVDNVASQRVLEKVGFEKEGVLRKYYVLHGVPRDMFMFSLLSTDFYQQS